MLDRVAGGRWQVAGFELPERLPVASVGWMDGEARIEGVVPAYSRWDSSRREEEGRRKEGARPKESASLSEEERLRSWRWGNEVRIRDEGIPLS